MDQFWEYEQWKPTDEVMENGPRPTKQEVEELRAQLILTTRIIKDIPHDPQAWAKRSDHLLALGFSELAAADAYKTIILCNAGLDYNYQSALGEYVRLIFGLKRCFFDSPGNIEMLTTEGLRGEVRIQLMELRFRAYFVLLRTLKRLQAIPDWISVCLETLKLYPNKLELQAMLQDARETYKSLLRATKLHNLSFEDTKKQLSYGSYILHTYPWMPQKYRVRSKTVIQAVNEDLKRCSDCLEVRRSPIQGMSDCYGMFATRRIRAFETILYATNPFSVSLEQTTTQCYNCFQVLATSKSVRRFSCCQTIGYCSPRCLNISRQYYHSAICGRDFSELVTRGQQSYGGKSEGSQYGNIGKTELSELTGWNDKPSKGYPKTNYRFPDQSPLVLARALAICLQAGGHPLEHPNIAQLTEGSESVRTVWSLNGMVIGPLKVLEILGVNIFSDERYETWVMRTLWLRIKNNSSSYNWVGMPNSVLSPLYCWFNHSCAPNAETGLRAVGSSAIEEQIATRDIEKSEEVCVSYIGDVEVNKAVRSEKLRTWLGNECKCRRCQVEV